MRIVLLSLFLCSCSAAATRTIVFEPNKLTTGSAKAYYEKGTLDLSIKLRDANPLCAFYQVKLSSATYTPQPALPALGVTAVAQGVSSIVAPQYDDCSKETELALARCSISSATTEAASLSAVQDKLLKWQRDLSGVWGKCDSPDAATALRDQVTTILNLKNTIYDAKLDTLISDVARAGGLAFATSRGLKVNLAMLGARLLPLKTASAQTKEQLEAAIKNNASAKDIEKLRKAASDAQEAQDEMQARYDELDKTLGVAGEWSEQLAKTQPAIKVALDTLRAEVAAALALVPATYTTGEQLVVRQVFEPNQLVTVEVVEIKRVGGKLVEKGGDRSLGTASIAVLRPIRFNVGIGPVVAFDWKRSYGVGANNTVIETDKAADLDGIVTVSGYYLPRYLDGTAFKYEALIPRPMLGLSLGNPLSSFYVGLQFDPIQFVDISIGAKLYSRSELADAQVGDMVMVAGDGKAVPPVTRSKLDAAVFVSLTASSGLFTSWITSLAK